ncbi:hypothetical protein BJY01DRAFT_203452 [Aspergillus pseudoustus]|uniref:NAD-dependent epimerase/dehydratase domain-containing protein n=1 Tax=Aspergillus pseudoustus TaxID=1810923 RepID=A0ABR4KW28_9EURO
MAPNLLLTGATGYIGGSVLRSLFAANIQPASIWAIVRSEAQADSLRPLQVNTVQAGLTDEDAVKKVVLNNSIDIVIHTVSAVDYTLAVPLLKALKTRKDQTGQHVHFIHTSGVTAFADKTGWPYGVAKESDDLYALQKAVTTPYPLRETDIVIHKTADEYGISVYSVVPPLVYGKGTGTGNKISVQIPTVIRAAIANKQVHRFAENSEWPAVHVADLAEYYTRLVVGIVDQQPLPSGAKGYYLVSPHTFRWHNVLSALAKELFARNLVSSAEVREWPSEEIKAKSLGLPAPYYEIAWNSNAFVLAEHREALGWKPEWDYTRFIRDIGEDVKAVLEAGTGVKDLTKYLPDQS